MPSFEIIVLGVNPAGVCQDVSHNTGSCHFELARAFKVGGTPHIGCNHTVCGHAVAETDDAVTAPVDAVMVSCAPAKGFKVLYVLRSPHRLVTL